MERTHALTKKIKAIYGFEGYKKVWAHRINSMGAMLEAKALFHGVELDIVFHERAEKFFVYHPPAENVGLELNAFLRQDNGKISYWLDWKNASPANFQAAIQRLEKLERKYSLKARIIVEVGEYFPEISELSGKGWNSSYYLPTNEVLDCVESNIAKKSDKFALAIKKRVKNGKFSAISFDARLYSFFDTFLRNFAKKNMLAVYIWDAGLMSDQPAIIGKLGNTSKIKTLMLY